MARNISVKVPTIAIIEQIESKLAQIDKDIEDFPARRAQFDKDTEAYKKNVSNFMSDYLVKNIKKDWVRLRQRYSYQRQFLGKGRSNL